MAIGDDLQVLLGMVPIRDRAGIARGTMADAAAAAAANDPHAEGQTLTRQGFDGARPPALALPPGMGRPAANGDAADIRLPDDVATSYASGKAMSPARAPSLGKGPVPGSEAPPADTERVVASSPAAAPSQEVIRGSDVMYKALQQQRRQELMQQLFHGLGQIVGGIRGENVPSRAAGGAGAGEGAFSPANIKTLIDMRAQEDQQATALKLRAQTIDDMRRRFNFSEEGAAAYFDSGEYKKLYDPAGLEKRTAAELAGTTREALLKPENVEALSKRLGQPPDVIRASIREGKIGAKELADIEGTQSTTAKQNQETTAKQFDFTNRRNAVEQPDKMAAELSTMFGRPISPTAVKVGALTEQSWQKYLEQLSEAGQADITSKQAKADLERAETRSKLADVAGIEEAQKTPAAVAERYRQMGYTDVTENVIKSAAVNGPSWTKFSENHQPLSTEALKDLAVENRMREAKGLPKMTPSEFKQQSQRPVLKTPQEETEGKVLDRYVTQAEDARKQAKAAKDFIEVDNETLQRHMNASPKLLLGPFSEKKLETRAFIADMLNMTDRAVNDTQAFKAQLKEYGLKVNQAFKGNFSDKDQKTVDAIIGEKYNEDTLRDIIELREKHQRLVWQAATRELEQYHAHPKHGEFIKSFSPTGDMPRLGTFMQSKFDAAGGEAAAIPKLQAMRNNPRALDAFDKQWGAGLSRELLRKADAATAATDQSGR